MLYKIWQHHAVPAACYMLITPGCSQWKKASGKEVITKMHIEKCFKSLLSIQNELKMQQMAISTLSLKKKKDSWEKNFAIEQCNHGMMWVETDLQSSSSSAFSRSCRALPCRVNICKDVESTRKYWSIRGEITRVQTTALAPMFCDPWLGKT